MKGNKKMLPISATFYANKGKNKIIHTVYVCNPAAKQHTDTLAFLSQTCKYKVCSSAYTHLPAFPPSRRLLGFFPLMSFPLKDRRLIRLIILLHACILYTLSYTTYISRAFTKRIIMKAPKKFRMNIMWATKLYMLASAADDK